MTYSHVVWSRVRPILTEYMIEMRAIRIEETVYNPRRRILVQAWTDFLAQPASFPNTDVDVLPHVADAALFKPFDDIIKAPVGVEVDRESFSPAFVALPSLARDWRKQIEKQLFAIIVAGYPKDYVPVVSVRQLATSVFACNVCDQLLFWIDAVSHNCGLESSQKRCADRNVPFKTHIARITEQTLGSTPWTPRFRSCAALAIRVIRSCCPVDPRSATVAQVDSTSIPFRCPTCSPDNTVMHWRQGVCSAFFVSPFCV